MELVSFFNRSECATDKRIINYRLYGGGFHIICFLPSITDYVIVFFGHGPFPYVIFSLILVLFMIAYSFYCDTVLMQFISLKKSMALEII